MAVLTSNPALNQKLMQLDREYEQQKNNLMQSYYAQPQQNNNWNNQNMGQPPQTNQGLLWVQGEAAARSYLVAPNSTVLLMDSDASRFYIKSADNAGMPSLRVFEYTEVSQSVPQAPQSEQADLDSKYVTRAEYDDLNGKCMEILDRLNNFPAAPIPANDGGKPAAATNKPRNKGGNDNG